MALAARAAPGRRSFALGRGQLGLRNRRPPGLPAPRALSGGTPPGGFRAWLVDAHKGALKQRELRVFAGLEELPQQDSEASVTVRVKFSDLNYKDAMILQGRHGVVRSFPIVPGIDLAGVVEQSATPMWKPGDEVVLTGNKIGQHFDGGYGQLCRVQGEWLVPRPKSFSLEECMAIGSAGFTAMQMVDDLEEAGGARPANGDVLVTGAGGGVGSMAVAILAQLGYSVVASTGRPEELRGYLEGLGASEVIGRLEGDGRKKPLQAQRWATVVDTVGGPTLAAALAQTKYLGCVACVGVAAGGDLDSTVYPFILRGVRLLGVDSTLPWNVDGYEGGREVWEGYRARRLALWARLERHLPASLVQKMLHATVPLEELPTWAERLLSGQVCGRVVVRV